MRTKRLTENQFFDWAHFFSICAALKFRKKQKKAAGNFFLFIKKNIKQKNNKKIYS
jgi:hypothetical protein